MVSLKRVLWLAIVIPFALMSSLLVSGQDSTPTPTEEAIVPECALAVIPTEEATALQTAEATLEATMTPLPAPSATLDLALEPLSATVIEPFDVRFNPNRDKAFAVVMNYTLTLQNNLSDDLEVRNPAFSLALEGVEWGELVSTDFRMGHIQGQRTHGIVLQNLMLMKNANDAQKAVLECIKAGAPIDVRVFGTVNTYPGGTETILTIDLTAEDLVLPTSN
jgi:hypothetical protein